VAPLQPQIEPGADEARGFWSCPDRRVAIGQAIAMAKHGDIVLIAGKGHEAHQIIGEIRYPFSDKEVATEALVERAVDAPKEAS